MTGEDHRHTTPDTPQDRREYFRIEDHIGLELRRVDSDDGADPFIDSPLEELKAEFRRLDQDVKTHLTTLAERDRQLAGLIKSLNSKLDTLERIITFEQNPLQPEDWQDVSLSEGSLCFVTPTPAWHPGDRLALRMTLPPELYQPRAMAEVFETDTNDQGQTRVCTVFTRISDSDRQQIARHVMRWQVRQRQNR